MIIALIALLTMLQQIKTREVTASNKENVGLLKECNIANCSNTDTTTDRAMSLLSITEKGPPPTFHIDLS